MTFDFLHSYVFTIMLQGCWLPWNILAANVNGIDLQAIAGAVASSVQQALQAQVQVTPGPEASTSKARFVCFVQLRSTHCRYYYPLRACATRITVLGLSFCVSVCLSVSTYSRTTGNKPAHERYQRL